MVLYRLWGDRRPTAVIPKRTVLAHPRWTWSTLGAIIITLAVLIVRIFSIQSARQDKGDKIVVLVARIDGPGRQNYRVSENLLIQLRKSFSGFDDTIIEGIDSAISEASGRAAALGLANRHQADIVVWGWYGATDSTAQVTIHVENLLKLKVISFSESDLYQVDEGIAQLQTFKIQHSVTNRLDSFVMTLSGLIRYEADDFGEALNRFERALSVPTDSTAGFGPDSIAAIAHFFKGNTCLQLGRFEDAEASYLAVLQRSAGRTEATYNLAISRLYLGRSIDALNDLDRYLAAVAHDSRARNIRGIVRASIGSWVGAIEDWRRAKMDGLTDPDVDYNIAMALYEQGQYSPALEYINTAIQRSNGRAGYYNGRGVILIALERDDEALADIDAAIRIDGGSKLFYTNRGRLKGLMRRHEESEDDFARALELAPGDTLVLLVRGMTRRETSRPDEAINDFSELLRISPRSLFARYNRAVAYQARFDLEAAIADYDTLIMYSPNNFEATYNRALLLVAVSRAEQAIRDLQSTLVEAESETHRQAARLTIELIKRGKIGLAANPPSRNLRKLMRRRSLGLVSDPVDTR